MEDESLTLEQLYNCDETGPRYEKTKETCDFDGLLKCYMDTQASTGVHW